MEPEKFSAGSHTLGAPSRSPLTLPDYKGTQNDSETLVNDQCIFLRGLYVKDRLLEEEEVEDKLSDDDVFVEELTPSTLVSPFNLKLSYI